MLLGCLSSRSRERGDLLLHLGDGCCERSEERLVRRLRVGARGRKVFANSETGVSCIQREICQLTGPSRI